MNSDQVIKRYNILESLIRSLIFKINYQEKIFQGYKIIICLKLCCNGNITILILVET